MRLPNVRILYYNSVKHHHIKEMNYSWYKVMRGIKSFLFTILIKFLLSMLLSYCLRGFLFEIIFFIFAIPMTVLMGFFHEDYGNMIAVVIIETVIIILVAL